MILPLLFTVGLRLIEVTMSSIEFSLDFFSTGPSVSCLLILVCLFLSCCTLEIDVFGTNPVALLLFGSVAFGFSSFLLKAFFSLLKFFSKGDL